MNRYTVFFFYNNRGMSSTLHVVGCDLPEGMVPADLAHGFWITDDDVWKNPLLTDMEDIDALIAARVEDLHRRGEQHNRDRCPLCRGV